MLGLRAMRREILSFEEFQTQLSHEEEKIHIGEDQDSSSREERGTVL